MKKLSLDTSRQGESEFLGEVRTITSIQHRNLVRLLGYCSDGPQRLLVYEYMKNRSLDLVIYGMTRRSSTTIFAISENYHYSSAWSWFFYDFCGHV